MISGTLNRFIRPQKFRMLTLDTIIPLLSQGDWFVVLNLQDAYFHICIRPSHQKYLRFQFNNVSYQFCSLPFGFSTVPRTFTKCMAPVMAYLCLWGINIYPYINNWLIVAKSHHEAMRATTITLDMLQSLGLKVNHAKSHLEPLQSITYIRALLDSIQAKAFIPLE